MEDVTARLGLPLLYAGQAQKELTHNEALTLLDLVVGGGVEAVGLDAPPAAPAIGAAWIVGEAPVGVWAGHARAVAGWTTGGWRFVAPVAGMSLWSRADGAGVRFDGAAWRIGELAGSSIAIGGVRVVGARRAAIADPAGGATVDGPARDAIAAILTALRQHGLIAV